MSAVLLALLAAKGFLIERSAVEAASPHLPPVPFETEARPGDVLVSAPALLAGGAILDEAVPVNVAGDDRTVKAGTALFRVNVAGAAGEALVGDSPTWCEPLRVTASMAGKAVLDAAAFGIFGNALRTHAHSVLCFVDADRDGRFESAFHSGAQRKGDRVLTPIGPVRYSAKAGGQHEALKRIGVAFAGASGGRLDFELRGLDAQGRTVARQPPVAMAAKAVPGGLLVEGADIDILAYDPATKTVRARVAKGVKPGPVAFGITELKDLILPPRQKDEDDD